MIQPSRRGFITGLIAFAAAPAIVRASSLMPVKAMNPELEWYEETATFLEGMSQRVAATLIYGTNFVPCCYSGFAHLERKLVRAEPITEFGKIDTSDPLWAMPKEHI